MQLTGPAAPHRACQPARSCEPSSTSAILHFKRVFALALIAAALFAQGAAAVTFSTPCSADLDVGTCERVDYLAQHADDDQRYLGWIVGALIGGFVLVPIMTRTLGRNA